MESCRHTMYADAIWNLILYIWPLLALLLSSFVYCSQWLVNYSISGDIIPCMFLLTGVSFRTNGWNKLPWTSIIFDLHIKFWVLRKSVPGLTLNVRGPSYFGLTRSISWLLMPCVLTSPGHQQPWYWLCGINTSWSYLGKDFKYMYHINVR